MLLQSAKNSSFEVDVKLIDEALAYMKRLYDPQRKTFRYEIHTDDPEYNHTRAMAGAGVLSLALSEDHYSEPSQNAARSILKRPFNQYDRPIEGEAFLCYGAFDSGHGMFQMGGEYWSEFFLQLVTTLFKTQRADGSWLMRQGLAAQFSGSYTTALTILALSPPDQMLPIFER